MPLSAGDKLGPYEILAPIGAGGMGEVYRAHELQREQQLWWFSLAKLDLPCSWERNVPGPIERFWEEKDLRSSLRKLDFL
jgi:hypothetical protein